VRPCLQKEQQQQQQSPKTTAFGFVRDDVDLLIRPGAFSLSSLIFFFFFFGGSGV
jgi:hypothetical protein